jgi:transcription initiation factor TFIID subunit TAF12
MNGLGLGIEVSGSNLPEEDEVVAEAPVIEGEVEKLVLEKGDDTLTEVSDQKENE